MLYKIFNKANIYFLVSEILKLTVKNFLEKPLKDTRHKIQNFVFFNSKLHFTNYIAFIYFSKIKTNVENVLCLNIKVITYFYHVLHVCCTFRNTMNIILLVYQKYKNFVV